MRFGSIELPNRHFGNVHLSHIQVSQTKAGNQGSGFSSFKQCFDSVPSWFWGQRFTWEEASSRKRHAPNCRRGSETPPRPHPAHRRSRRRPSPRRPRGQSRLSCRNISQADGTVPSWSWIPQRSVRSVAKGGRASLTLKPTTLDSTRRSCACFLLLADSPGGRSLPPLSLCRSCASTP